MDITPNLTPQQINEQRNQKDKQVSNNLLITSLTQSDPLSIINNLPSELQLNGAAKFASILDKKNNNIKEVLITKIVNLASIAGIENIGTSPKLPENCLNQKDLDKFISDKNEIVDKLNITLKLINNFSKILTGYSNIIDVTKVTISTLDISRNALVLSTNLIPSPPGIPGSVISTLENIKSSQDLITPTLYKSLGAVSSMQISISSMNDTLLKIMKLLDVLDQYIKKCAINPQLTLLDKDLILLKDLDIQKNTNDLYNGFNLEIIEEPYSPTVNRRKAVAKNKNGIILLSTPLTFSTDNQTLINEIKLLIDSNNLKAD